MLKTIFTSIPCVGLVVGALACNPGEEPGGGETTTSDSSTSATTSGPGTPHDGVTTGHKECDSADCEDATTTVDPCPSGACGNTTHDEECDSADCEDATTIHPCDTAGCGSTTIEECDSADCEDATSTTDPCGPDGCGNTTHDEECDSADCEDATTTDSDGDTDTGVAPRRCAPGAGDLTALWTRSDPATARGEAVAVGDGRVAWVASDHGGTHLRVLNLDGGPVWAASMALAPGWGLQPFKDVAVGPAGAVVIAGEVLGGGGVVRWFDASGALQGEQLEPGAAWDGAVWLADGSVAVAGALADDILVRRFTPAHALAWSQSFAEMGAAWAADLVVTAEQGLVVAGHSNLTPGPVLLGYDPAGALAWSRIEPGGSDEVSHGVALDGAGRIYRTVYADLTGRVDRLDASGQLEASVALDYMPHSIAVDADGNFVVAGRDHDRTVVVVERRAPDGDLLALHERPGYFALDVAVDAECHTYVVGDQPLSGGAWLDKLN